MKHTNISFKLGDDDCSEVYHFEMNHSAEKIEEAIPKVNKLLGFDFLTAFCETENDLYIYGDKLKTLRQFPIIPEDLLERSSDNTYTYYFEDTNDYIAYIFNCIGTIIPDINGVQTNSEGTWLSSLNGRAKGLLIRKKNENSNFK